jgi:glycosyltransferase involved in cell wall biosynthesis
MLSMHDIQHVHFPEFFSKFRIRVRTLRFYNSALASTRIQASSNFIKNDLLKHFSFLDSKRVKIITEGVNLDDFSGLSTINIKDKFSLPQKFIFFPATLWKHKNHISVLKALKIIEETKGIKIPLILTGGKNTAYNDLMSFIKENEMSYVRYLGKVSWEELIALYKNAYLLITAVLYESSSLPILEASASNLPIIASKTPPNEEMGKVLKLNLFDPNDVNDLVVNLINCWNNLDLKPQKEFNIKKIELYSWKNIAKEYHKDFNLLLNNKC